VLEGIHRRGSIAESPRRGLFITSERYADWAPRLYTVRFFDISRDADGRDHIEIGTASDFQEFDTAQKARQAADLMAADPDKWAAIFDGRPTNKATD
jgi:hypothetical protein